MKWSFTRLVGLNRAGSRDAFVGGVELVKDAFLSSSYSEMCGEGVALCYIISDLFDLLVKAIAFQLCQSQIALKSFWHK